MMSSVPTWAGACLRSTAARLAVAALTAISLAGCGSLVRGVQGSYQGLVNSEWFWHGRHGALTEKELAWATTAWRYVQRNTQADSGLVGAIDGYPGFTMTNLAEYLAALNSAYRFSLVEEKEFDERLSAVLEFLNEMDLVGAGLPNRSYHAATGDMVDYGLQPAQVGWSALELGRLLIWLNYYRRHYPRFAEYIDKAVLRWDFCGLLDDDGSLMGGRRTESGWQRYQEGRLGYEEYATYGYYLWGFDPARADRLEPFEVRRFYRLPLLVDGRDPREDGVIAPLVPTPYWYAGMEFNWDNWGDKESGDTHHSRPHLAEQAKNLYLIQERRWQEDALYTARAEHLMSEPPYFVYDAIFGLGSPFPTLDDQGNFHDDDAMVATKAVFMMWVLWNREYTDRLMAVTEHLYDAERGWYEGRWERSAGYEQVFSLSTNAAVLQALLYKVEGKLFRQPPPISRLERVRGDEFIHPGRCQPYSENTP